MNYIYFIGYHLSSLWQGYTRDLLCLNFANNHILHLLIRIKHVCVTCH